MPKNRMWTVVPGLIFVGAAYSLLGCSGSGEITPPPQGKPLQRLLIESHVPLPAAEISKLPANFERKIGLTGWTRDAQSVKRSLPAKNVSFTNGTQTVTTDARGYFLLPENVTSNNWKILVDGKATDQPQLESSKSDSTSSPLTSSSSAQIVINTKESGNWTFEVPFSCCAQSKMACCKTPAPSKSQQEPKSNVAARNPMNGRCLDYNGWWTDGQNYERDSWRHTWLAFRNFLGSDCDYAMYRGHNCWRDHSSSCWSVHGSGGCSRLIGHSSDYHRH